MPRGKSNKIDITKEVITGLGVGSGVYAGSQINTLLERNIMPENIAPYTGAVTFALGVLGSAYLPYQAKSVGWGISGYGAYALGNMLTAQVSGAMDNSGGDTATQGVATSRMGTNVNNRLKKHK